MIVTLDSLFDHDQCGWVKIISLLITFCVEEQTKLSCIIKSYFGLKLKWINVVSIFKMRKSLLNS